MMKHIYLFFISFLFVASSVWAYDFEKDGVYYTKYNNAEGYTEAMVTYKDKNTSSYSGKIKIPYEVWCDRDRRYYEVTRIDNNAFKDCTGLTSVSIPKSVTMIGSGAFEGCTSLKSITIPESVRWINESAFSGCSGLTSITIPDGVRIIWNNAFEDCTSLTSITIPNSVTVITDKAFKGCTGIKSITIPESVTKIGRSAFQGCTGLTSITIPKNVTSIEDSTFYGCTKLASATIPEGVTSIGSRAFAFCDGLNSINIPQNITTIEESTFFACKSLTSITIPEGVTSIGNRAFWGCKGLTSITIPESVTKIGSDAFSGCAFTSINVPEALDISSAALGFKKDGLYYELVDLTKVSVAGGNVDDLIGEIEIPSTVSLGDYTFEVISIEAKGFRNHTGLTSIKIPESVTSIGASPFLYCTGLTSVICMATTPPAYSYQAYTLIPKSVTLYVPCESVDLYRNKDCWGSSIECISCNVSLSANDDAQGSVEGDGEFLLGETVTITAKPASGYKFEQWSDGNTENPRTITVNSDMNYTAIFVEIPVYSINLGVNDASYGSVKGGGEFEEGATVSISATANSGYKFTQWNDGNAENPRKVTVSSDINFTAVFEENPIYTVSVTANDASFGSVKGGGEFEEGSTTSISATVKRGYKFTQWNDGNTENPRTITVTESCIYVATFEKISTAISEVENGTTITIANNQILVNGEAPAFVTNISGQKIANQNLKSGVYFVNIEGETVKVVK